MFLVFVFFFVVVIVVYLFVLPSDYALEPERLLTNMHCQNSQLNLE